MCSNTLKKTNTQKKANLKKRQLHKKKGMDLVMCLKKESYNTHWKLLVTLMLKMHTFQTLNNSWYASSSSFDWCLLIMWFLFLFLFFFFTVFFLCLSVAMCVLCDKTCCVGAFSRNFAKKNTIDTQWRIWSWQWWLWKFLWLFYSFEFSWKLMWNFENHITVFQKSGFLAPGFN